MKPKIVVLVPTRDRPKYLNLTLDSVCEQAARFGHHVEVVLSDQSDGKNSVANQQFVKKLEKQYAVPIHYYHKANDDVVRCILEDASEDELKAFETLVPKDGHYGAHRNRLALLGAFHGGENALYLHLDDDTPMLKVTESGSVKRHENDVFSAYLAAFAHAKILGKPGFSARVFGVSDGALSSGRARKSADLKGALVRRKASVKDVLPSGHSMAPGRMLDFEAMTEPYHSRGKNEDFHHTDLVYANAITRGYRSDNRAPGLLHVGITGKKPIRSLFSFYPVKIKPRIRESWRELTSRAARLEH